MDNKKMHSIPEGYQVLKLNPHWKVFSGDDRLKEIAATVVYGDRIELADGVKLDASDLVLENDKTDLNVFYNARVEVGAPTLLISTIDSENEEKSQIGIGVDWWFNCYLNGELLYSTLESGGNRNAVPEKSDHIFDLPLKKGTNTVALLMLAGSSSRKIAVGAVPFKDLSPRTAELRNGPWLLNPASGACSIRFTSDGKMAGGIDIRRKGDEEFKRIWHTSAGIILRDRELHSIELKNLLPCAEYEYRLILQYTDTNQVRVLPTLYEFIAPGGEVNNFSLFISGDTQLMPEHRETMVSKLFNLPGAKEAEFFVHVGDAGSTFNNFESDYFDGMMDVFFKASRNRSFFIPLRGNHDFIGAECAEYMNYFGTPDGKPFQAFSCGDCFFVVLDTGTGGAPDPFDPQSYMYVLWDEHWNEQREWFAKVVNSEAFKKAKFRVVFAHFTPAMMPDNPHEATELRDLISPWFEGDFSSAPIDLWIGGHVHVYRRSIPGSSEFLTNRMVNERHAVHSGAAYNFPVITVDGPNKLGTELSGSVLRVTPEYLELSSFDLDGKLIDHFKLYRDKSIEEFPVDLPLMRCKL